MAISLGVCVALAACPSSPKATPPPAGLPPFYGVPGDARQKSPGVLLKSERVAAPGIAGTAHRIMYVSKGADNRSAPVTGLVFVPSTPPPNGGYPIVSWAHGTNGMAPECAPSLHPSSALPTPTILNAMLALGWEVVATDYQTEKTTGLVPYLVGDVAARDAIDAVVATRHLPEAHASPRYIVWGHSEGGQTALFAWQMATDYGARSGLRMLGAVAGAPPSQLPALFTYLAGSPSRVYDYMMLAGFNAAYGATQAPLDAVLSTDGTTLLPALHQGCLASVASAVNARPFTTLVKQNQLEIPTWSGLFARNDPASFRSAPKVPLLIVHGAADEVIPATTSATLGEHLCKLGASLERWVYPAQNHGGTLIVSAIDVGRWMSARFAEGNAPARVQPAGGDVQVHDCTGLTGR